MMTSSRFVVCQEADKLATRSAGRELCAQLISRLQDSLHVTLDFQGVSLTPSFADEFLGMTIQRLGRDQFKRRVTMVNVSESAKVLIRHILNARARQASVLESDPTLIRQHA